MYQTSPFFLGFKPLILLLIGLFAAVPALSQHFPPELVKMEKGLDSLAGKPRFKALMDLAKHSAPIDIQRSRTYLRSAYDLAAHLEISAYQARALNGMGITHFMQGNLDSALSYYRQSLAINIAAMDSAGLAVNYSNLSNVHVELGDYNKAIEFFFNGLALSRLMNDSLTQADIHNNIARLYTRLKMYDESINHTKQSIAIYKAIGEEDFITNYNNLGISYDDIGKVDSAIYFFRKCINLAKESGERPGLYLACTNISGAFSRLGRLDSARYYLDIALNDSALESNPRFFLTVGISEVGVLIKEGKYQEALDKAFDFLKLAKAARRIKEQASLFGHIQAANAELGNYKEAYRYYGKYSHITDSLRSESNLTEITRIQERYEYQIQKERLEDEHNEVLREEKSEKQRSYYILGFLALLSLLLGYMAYVRRRRNMILRAKNQEIERQNQEIQEQGEELRTQKRNLEALNSFKNRVLAVMAHDLKSPLNSLQSLLDLSSMDELQDPKLVKDMMSKLAAQLVIVRQSVENLLHWAKLQLGSGSDSKPTGVHLGETLSEVIALYGGMAESKEIKVNFKLDNPEVSLKVSPEVLKIVLRNLVSNAFKFSPVKGQVIIRSELNETNCRVSVRDFGPGLRPEQKALIFSETMHATEGSGKEKGTGLGLYLSGEFIRKEGGQIGVNSEEGKGSEFWFSLPIFTKFES